MNKLGEIISEELFVNAFHICRSYCTSGEILFDVNFLLLKDRLTELSDRRVRSYYKKYVATDLLYSLPELFSADLVSVPKKLSSLREYRFFSVPSMLLYNAAGLLFVDSCSRFIEQLDFTRRNVFSFYPTKFQRGASGWEARNDYRTEYKGFSDRLKTAIQPGDVVLRLDISNYFETISHAKLVSLLRRFSPASTLAKHNVSRQSLAVLEFYFESLMQRRQGIPQGRKNFLSDYFGYLYLLPFDIAAEQLTDVSNLKFKCLIRYVDDVFVVMASAPNLRPRQVFKDLLVIEQRIVSWLYGNLGLNLTAEKTQREIIHTPSVRDEFLKTSKKAVSSRPELENEADDAQKTEMEQYFKEFVQTLQKFRIPEVDRFDFDLPLKDRETLKHVLSKPFQSFLLKRENIEKVQTLLNRVDFELTAEQINIVIALFYLEQDNKRPFFEILQRFLQTQMNLKDKRHIHILLACFAQASGPPKLKTQIKKSAATLRLDDYGKYLLCFYGLESTSPDDSVYRRICNEHKGARLKRGLFLFTPLSDFERLVEFVAKYYSDQQTIIQPLKHYIYERWNERWDVAFNHFQNVFHELCKLKFSLRDTATITDVTTALKDISVEDELLLMKFYDRRNFNAISHPSQKGKPSVKVSREDLVLYEPKLLALITRHLLN